MTPETETVVTLPVLPLKNTVLFPYLFMPLSVGRPGSVAAVEAVLATEDSFLLRNCHLAPNPAKNSFSKGIQRHGVSGSPDSCATTPGKDPIARSMSPRNSMGRGSRVVSGTIPTPWMGAAWRALGIIVAYEG